MTGFNHAVANNKKEASTRVLDRKPILSMNEFITTMNAADLINIVDFNLFSPEDIKPIVNETQPLDPNVQADIEELCEFVDQLQALKNKRILFISQQKCIYVKQPKKNSRRTIELAIDYHSLLLMLSNRDIFELEDTSIEDMFAGIAKWIKSIVSALSRSNNNKEETAQLIASAANMSKRDKKAASIRQAILQQRRLDQYSARCPQAA